jgi:hypothetical protein
VIGRMGDEVFFHDPGLLKRPGREVVCRKEQFIKAWEYPSRQPGQGIGVIIR